MSEPQLKVAILIESDYYEKEIFYYEHRFAEENIEAHFVSRLWGNASLTFTGHEQKYPFVCTEDFTNWSDETLRSFAGIIVPSAFVSDRLRYSEDVTKLAPATDLVRRAFQERSIVKGIICHGMWLLATVPELVRGRPVVCHNNLVGDVRNMGAIYTDRDLVVDGDLVTARTGGHCHLLARQMIQMMTSAAAAAQRGGAA
jgi:protease I